jgi:hypothetical protein
VNGTNFVYVPSGETFIPLTTQTVTVNDFVSAPTNSHLNWFSVANSGFITVANQVGSIYFNILARIIGNGGFTLVGEQLFKLWVDPAGATPAKELSSVMINPVLGAPTQNIVLLQSNWIAQAGDVFYVTLESAVAPTVQLEYQITVLK